MLLGDAAHTAHFSIGSGTKLAMEDAVALAWAFRAFGDDVGRALSSYEAERRPIVESTQRAAQASLEWFEGLGRYVEQERTQFAFNLLTRSRRVTYDNLRPARIRCVRGRLGRRFGVCLAAVGASGGVRCHRRGRRCSCRSGCGSCRCRTASSSRRWTCTRPSTGLPSDFHLVHLGARVAGRRGARDDRDDLRLG